MRLTSNFSCNDLSTPLYNSDFRAYIENKANDLSCFPVSLRISTKNSSFELHVSVQYQDYYKTLGVSRNASQEEITKSYRKLARKFHPDLNKGKDAEDKFKEINEAHEVLKDPETRKRYDLLGENWKNGQQFQPPPGWEDIFGGFGGNARGYNSGGANRTYRSSGAGAEGMGGFSDFFNSFFSGQAAGGQAFGGSGQSQRNARAGGQQQKGDDIKSTVYVSLEDVDRGATKNINLSSRGGDHRTYDVKIPQGIAEGKTLRLKGKGEMGAYGAPGDLLLTVQYQNHKVFTVEHDSLRYKLELSPWEAALGAKLRVPTLDGAVMLTVPSKSSSGDVLKVKGKGLHKGKNARGDLFVVLSIVIPKDLSEEETNLYRQLKDVSLNTAKEEV